MIPRIKRVLYATDLSKNAMFAFRYAVNTAEKHDAEMIVLHVIEEIPPAVRAYAMLNRNIENIRGGVIEGMSATLDEFCKRELQEKPLLLKRIKGIKVEEGYPADEILKVADEQKCDVIIMGTHGKGMLTHAFLGSVAERVLRRSRKPVFIIPLPEE